MKYQDALDIMNKETGYMVSFEKRIGSCLHSDHFPDKHAGENLIESIGEAWHLARRFGAATDPMEIVNIYVIDHTFSPIVGYDRLKIRGT